jgi:hypothetical protein
MRSLEMLFLLGFIALIGLGAWSFRDRMLPSNKSADVAVAAARAAAVRATAEKTNEHAKHGKGSTRVAASDPVLEQLLSSTTTVDVVVPGPRMPHARDLRPGMTGGDIRAHFGEPILRTTKAENGEISERYYYVDKESGRITVANLQAGVVVSAESKPL